MWRLREANARGERSWNTCIHIFPYVLRSLLSYQGGRYLIIHVYDLIRAQTTASTTSTTNTHLYMIIKSIYLFSQHSRYRLPLRGSPGNNTLKVVSQPIMCGGPTAPARPKTRHTDFWLDPENFSVLAVARGHGGLECLGCNFRRVTLIAFQRCAMFDQSSDIRDGRFTESGSENGRQLRIVWLSTNEETLALALSGGPGA